MYTCELKQIARFYFAPLNLSHPAKNTIVHDSCPSSLSTQSCSIRKDRELNEPRWMRFQQAKLLCKNTNMNINANKNTYTSIDTNLNIKCKYGMLKNSEDSTICLAKDQGTIWVLGPAWQRGTIVFERNDAFGIEQSCNHWKWTWSCDQNISSCKMSKINQFIPILSAEVRWNATGSSCRHTHTQRNLVKRWPGGIRKRKQIIAIYSYPSVLTTQFQCLQKEHCTAS